MKTKNSTISFENLTVFALSNQEMISVRGGGEPGTHINISQIKI
jgi:hypothetical protein